MSGREQADAARECGSSRSDRSSADLGDPLEVRNFLEIVSTLKVSAGRPPEVEGVQIAGVSLPRREPAGGDHIIYIDFRERFDLQRRIGEAEARGATTVAQELRRCAHRGGILLADISGHRTTDALVAVMLHQAFLLGTYYELDRSGRITTELFEHLNQRFYETTAISRYFTMIYGEISDEGKFRFICAGHPPPLVYSREFRSFAAVPREHVVSFPPVGLVPSGEGLAERAAPSSLGFKSRYAVSRIDLLAPGDLMILYTDGLSDLSSGNYIPERLLGLIQETADLSAREIADRIHTDVLQAPDREDDVSLVVIKRSSP